MQPSSHGVETLDGNDFDLGRENWDQVTAAMAYTVEESVRDERESPRAAASNAQGGGK